MWIWLNDNAAGLGIVLAVVPATWAAWTYIQTKRADQRQLRFQNYHQLVQWLIQGDQTAPLPSIDRQLAVVFELRNYREYRSATVRILRNFNRLTVMHNPWENIELLVEEIHDTIAELEVHRLGDILR